MPEKFRELSTEEKLIQLREDLQLAKSAGDIARVFRLITEDLMGEVGPDIFKAQQRVDAIEAGEGDLMLALNF